MPGKSGAEPSEMSNLCLDPVAVARGVRLPNLPKLEAEHWPWSPKHRTDNHWEHTRMRVPFSEGSEAAAV